MAKKDLTFKKLHDINRKRCEESYHPIDDWSPSDWFMSAISELGEGGNFLKKIRRLDSKINNGLTKKERKKKEVELTKEVAKELADTLCYLDLLATRLGIDLESALIEKFNEVSDRVGSKYKL